MKLNEKQCADLLKVPVLRDIIKSNLESALTRLMEEELYLSTSADAIDKMIAASLKKELAPLIDKYIKENGKQLLSKHISKVLKKGL